MESCAAGGSSLYQRRRGNRSKCTLSPCTAFEDEGTGIHARVGFLHVRAVCDCNKSVVPYHGTQPCACVIPSLPRQFEAFPHPSVAPLAQHFPKGAGFNCGGSVVREQDNFYHPHTPTSDCTWPTPRSYCSPFLCANMTICSRSCPIPKSWFTSLVGAALENFETKLFH